MLDEISLLIYLTNALDRKSFESTAIFFWARVKMRCFPGFLVDP